MKILVLSTDYKGFLRWFAETQPDLRSMSYIEQEIAHTETLFGSAGALARSFKASGHLAKEIYANNMMMQGAWAREHGIILPGAYSRTVRDKQSSLVQTLKRNLRQHRAALFPIARMLGLIPSLDRMSKQILLAQIEDFQPDVILNQELAVIGSDVMRTVQRKDRILIAQCGIDLPPGIDLRPYNLGVSLLPWVVREFVRRGLPAKNWHLAFNDFVLDRMGPAPEPDIDVSFVGSVSADHDARIKLLEAVADRFPLTLHLSSESNLASNSPLKKYDQGPVWGKQMYEVLRRSKISLNSHVGAAKGMAGNMRLYEATGVGAFLLTDRQSNLGDLFDAGQELGAYMSEEDCATKISFYLQNDSERNRIALNGQQRTLSTHTYGHRVRQLLSYIEQM